MAHLHTYEEKMKRLYGSLPLPQDVIAAIELEHQGLLQRAPAAEVCGAGDACYTLK